MALGIWGCASDPNSDSVRDPADVEVIALDSTAPAVEADSVSFYAVVGQKRSADIYFDSAGVRLERLLSIEIGKWSLYRKPDGSRFGWGDSVLITVRASNPAGLEFTFEPSGLVFSPFDPAELTISYGRALSAVAAEDLLAIWRQETPNTSYYRLKTKVHTNDKEVEADIPGFSKYAVAY